MRQPWVFTFFLLGLAAPALSAPVITSISGTVATGQSVTINGSGFGTKSPAPPIIWADFEAGSINPRTLGQNTTWNAILNLSLNQGGIQTDAGSVYNSSGTWGFTFHFQINQNPWTKIYNYQKRYFTYGPGVNQKFWRLWREGTQGPNDFVAIYSTTNGHTCYNEKEAAEPEGVSGIGGYQGTDYIPNTWQTEEFRWSYSGEGNGVGGRGGTGVWKYHRNGVKVQQRENVDNGSNNLVELMTDSYTDPPDHKLPDGTNVLMDNIYIDNTYARVMVVNNSSFTAANVREIFVPATWSDTQITGVVNVGSMTGTAFFNVLNSSETVSNSFQVTIGETYAPAQPTSTSGTTMSGQNRGR